MSAQDIPFIALSIFAIAITFFAMAYFGSTIIDKFKENEVINGTASAVEVLNKTDAIHDRLDYVVFVLFVSSALLLIVTGWLVGGDPIFAILYFFFVLFSILISALCSNMWEEFTAASAWGTTLLSFPITNHILLFFPMYISIMGMIGLIIMFAKPYVVGGGSR